MSDLRAQPRVAVHYRVEVRHGGRAGRGLTENLSERGTMMSVELVPAPVSGDVVVLGFTLPDGTLVDAPGRVRWASAVLPGMIGVEFDVPMPSALRRHVDELLASLPGAPARAAGRLL